MLFHCVHHIYPIIERKRTRAGANEAQSGLRNRVDGPLSNFWAYFLGCIFCSYCSIYGAHRAHCASAGPSRPNCTVRCWLWARPRCSVVFRGPSCMHCLVLVVIAVAAVHLFLVSVAPFHLPETIFFSSFSLLCSNYGVIDTKLYTYTTPRRHTPPPYVCIEFVDRKYFHKQSDRRRKRERREIREWPAQQGNR